MAIRTINLRAAVAEIQTAYQNREHGQPFFFVVGAGVSAPAIPLANAIAAHCRSRVQAADATDVVTSSHPLDVYSYWFDRAYPQAADRQRYLKSLIQNRPIPNACLRFAHIISSGRFVNLIVTSNFDDFLPRALGVFGAPYVECDHPSTVDRLDLAAPEIKIVHVHGSYKFYDCRNLREELEDRARPSLSTTRTMSAFLDRVLSSSSPLVIGYSGWDGDVIMCALRRRIEDASLPYRLYWFAHTQQDLSDLQVRAPWLMKHPDVRVVVADETDVVGTPTIGQQEGTTAAAASLPAQLVFEELSRQFKLAEPELTRDPVRFFARQVRAALAVDVEEEKGNLYSFASVVARLERAAKLEADDFRLQGGHISRLEPVRRLLRESQYSRALDAAATLLDSLDEPGRVELYDVVDDLIRNTSLATEDRLRASMLAISVGDSTRSINETLEYRTKHLTYRRAIGEALYQLNRPADAVTEFERLLEEFANDKDGVTQHHLRLARAGKALALATANRVRDAISEYDSLIPDLRRHSSERWLLIQSQYNRAIHLARDRQVEEAMIELGKFADEYRHDGDTVTKVLVAAALQVRAELLATAGHTADAIEILTNLVELFGDTDSHRLAKVVAAALLDRARLQQTSGLMADATRSLEAFDRLSSRFAPPNQLPAQLIADAAALQCDGQRLGSDSRIATS